MTSLPVDHVIYAVDDLEAASVRFIDDFGLASVDGGRHPGHGTANRIIPLGPDYIELIAVVDPSEATVSPLGAKVMAAGEGWIGYAVRSQALEQDIDDVGDVVEMSRTRRDGVELSWRIAEFQRFVAGEGPFVIEWNVDDALLPGAAPAEHHGSPTGITALDLVDGSLRAVTVGLATGDEIVI